MTDTVIRGLICTVGCLLLRVMAARGGNAANAGGDVGDEVIVHCTRFGDAEKLCVASCSM